MHLGHLTRLGAHPPWPEKQGLGAPKNKSVSGDWKPCDLERRAVKSTIYDLTGRGKEKVVFGGVQGVLGRGQWCLRRWAAGTGPIPSSGQHPAPTSSPNASQKGAGVWGTQVLWRHGCSGWSGACAPRLRGSSGKDAHQNKQEGTSLAVSKLPVQGAQVRSLVRELDPTCCN